jgi:hypothetical protein
VGKPATQGPLLSLCAGETTVHPRRKKRETLDGTGLGAG